jgi:hypothetical protein
LGLDHFVEDDPK